MPIDILDELKNLSIEMIHLDNEDITRHYSSWKHFVEEQEIELLKSNKQILDVDDFQQKYIPELIFDNSDTSKKRKRFDVIVMASLIDKAPNLGGLARTCEIFNIGAMTIASESYLKDSSFTTAASSAEKWLPLVYLNLNDIENYLLSYKKLGYKIIGLEQTHNSVQLAEFKFVEKCIIVLGNEKEGIPQNLINLCDNCIIIPQYGQVRSLNVHVSAALMLWQLVNTIQIS